MKNVLFVLGCAAVLTIVLAVECPDDDGETHATYYPHETECGKFYECDHGTAYIFECPPGLYWDSRLNVCNRNVNCGELSTSTTPPETTEATDFVEDDVSSEEESFDSLEADVSEEEDSLEEQE